MDLALRGLVEASTNSKLPCSGVEISKHLLTNHASNVHWKSIEAALRKAKGLAHSSKRNGRWVFNPLKAALDRVNGANDSIALIDPSKAVMATVRLHDTLAALSGLVRLCDPYLDQKSLHHLDAIPEKTTLRVLTFNITDSGTTRSLVQAFAAKGVVLEIRKAHANVLHDRYLVAGGQVLILGTSLNGFGKKQCFVIRAGQSIADSLQATFDGLWAKATPWP
jgi:hypothetical protein